jgi:hypothetical protein
MGYIAGPIGQDPLIEKQLVLPGKPGATGAHILLRIKALFSYRLIAHTDKTSVTVLLQSKRHTHDTAKA